MISPVRSCACAMALAAAAWAPGALAQDYPARPIRLIVATAPGGLMDVPARVAAEHLDRAFGQRVLVENRGGAGGNLGADAVVKAAPDGHTLGLVQLGNFAINPFLFKNMPFDPMTDLVPVAPITSSPVVVAISAKVPANDLREFIAYARRQSGKLNHGSAGIGTVPHLAGELFAHLAGVKLEHVHYKGAGPALADLVAGQVQVIFVGYGVVRGQAAAGAVRVLAVSQAARLGSAPNVPTAGEAGLPGFEVTTWFGIVAPKGTPERIVATLNRQIHAMQDDPAVVQRFAGSGLDVLKETPEQFAAHIRRDYEKYRDIVKAAGLKPE